jgi:hypothetical protein
MNKAKSQPWYRLYASAVVELDHQRIATSGFRFYLSFLYVKNSIGRVALNKDRLLFGKRCDLPTAVDGRKECLGIEFAAFLGRNYGCHDWPPLKNSNAQEATSYEQVPTRRMDKMLSLLSHRQFKYPKENNGEQRND